MRRNRQQLFNPDQIVTWKAAGWVFTGGMIGAALYWFWDRSFPQAAQFKTIAAIAVPAVVIALASQDSFSRAALGAVGGFAGLSAVHLLQSASNQISTPDTTQPAIEPAAPPAHSSQFTGTRRVEYR